jgi:hypothetical protein
MKDAKEKIRVKTQTMIDKIMLEFDWKTIGEQVIHIDVIGLKEKALERLECVRWSENEIHIVGGQPNDFTAINYHGSCLQLLFVTAQGMS